MAIDKCEYEDGELNPGHDEYVDCYWDEEIKDFIPINGGFLRNPRMTSVQ